MITIKSFIVSNKASVRDSLAVINGNAHGICFVVDDLQKLVGVVTDGDIRRALLKNISLDDSCETIMMVDYTALPVGTSSDKVFSLLNDKIRVIPLVDENNVPVDFASFSKMHRTPIMQPEIGSKELEYVTECIKTGWISSQGAFVKRFEQDFAELCGSKYALAVSNGTVALHLAMVACGIGRGDEVLVPNLTFAASANAVIHAGAIPVFVDVDTETWNISIEEIEKSITPKTRAIMPVHLYGHPCAMDEITAIAEKHNLIVVEDCAEALGSLYKGQHVGVFGDAACFSFFGNKTITTGEGGMILFKDEQTYEKAAMLRDHGMSRSKKYWHEEVGYNYRMTNLQAAIGCAQLEKLSGFVNRKREIAKSYNELLQSSGSFTIPVEKEWAKSGFWLYTALFNDESIERDELIDKFLKNGIETRPMFYPLHLMPAYKEYSNDQEFPNSVQISSKGISFPSSVNLTDEEIENIKHAINQIFTSARIAE